MPDAGGCQRSGNCAPQVEETGCSARALAAWSAPAFILIFTQRSTRSDTFGSLNPTCTPMRPISAKSALPVTDFNYWGLSRPCYEHDRADHLQLALDHTSLQAAQRDVAGLDHHADIIEAGTIYV